MSIYTQRKLNASRFDLSPEQVQDFVECWEAVCNNGLARSIREPVLVQLLQDFGRDKVIDGIRGLIGRTNWSPDTLLGLIEGSIPRERPKPASAQETRSNVNSRSNTNDPTLLRNILDKTVPYRVPKIEQKEVRNFNENQAFLWMNEHGYEHDAISDLFYEAGLDQNMEKVYRLRDEEIQKTSDR